jgi:hypothetical protein
MADGLICVHCRSQQVRFRKTKPKPYRCLRCGSEFTDEDIAEFAPRYRAEQWEKWEEESAEMDRDLDKVMAKAAAKERSGFVDIVVGAFVIGLMVWVAAILLKA